MLSRVVQPVTNFSHRNGMGGCQQVAFFSKYTSRSRTKRMPLNTKRVGKGYYKGTGSRKEGKITSKGNRTLFLVYVRAVMMAMM